VGHDRCVSAAQHELPDATIVLAAARASVALRLPMADSVMLATARMHKATLWTQDADLNGIEGVEYAERRQVPLADDTL